jgi:hypothetical protein
MEMRNVGSFDSPIRVANELPPEIQIPRMISICNHYKIFMKEHNADYLSTDSLKWQPRLGIHAANIAPEFGVAESKAFIDLMENSNQNILLEEFLRISYDSKKWEKWMINATSASDKDKAIISGHYIFSTAECLELKNQARFHIKDLDTQLKNKVKESVFRYMKAFNLV